MTGIIDINELLEMAGAPVPEPARSRDMPLKPILRYAVFRDDHIGRWREILTHAWRPGPKLCWISYSADKSTAELSNLTIKRITGWSYRAGYAGLTVVSLYPVVMWDHVQVQAWRTSDPDTFNLMMQAATNAGQASRDATDIVVATGPLNPAEVSDFESWIGLFRDARGRRKTRWLCIGTTEYGWPLPPAGRGRTPPPAEVRLRPWTMPTVHAPRETDQPANSEVF